MRSRTLGGGVGILFCGQLETVFLVAVGTLGPTSVHAVRISSRRRTPALIAVPWAKYGVAGCGCDKVSARSESIMMSRSVDDVFGIGLCLGKNWTVLETTAAFVAGS